MKKNKPLEKFILSEAKNSSAASENLLKLLEAKKLTQNEVRELVRKIGIKVSEPTFIRWIHDPYYMSIYEIKALSKALHIKNEYFINIVFGFAKIEVFTNIEAIAV